MEYKTVRGGDEFLPFARNLVRKLRATGLSQAAQKVNVGSVSITVRIADENDFISIEGGAPTILSGVIKAGEVVNIPADPGPPVVAAYDTLRAFKPTQNCWETVLGKNPAKPTSSFNDEKKLAKAGTQYADLAPSMFSGLMAKAVQVLMGMGIEVKYEYKFDKCHGIVLDDKGKPWLVEISKTNGVIAQKLGITPIGKNSSERNDARRECAKLFGGIPTGKTFPKDADIEAAIEAKTVFRLLTTAEMEPFFDKTAFTQEWGWSFNTSGTQGHNTCYTDVAGTITSYHYKLLFTLLNDKSTLTAALSKESEGPLTEILGSSDPRNVINFRIAGALLPSKKIATDAVATEATFFVRHKGDTLDRLKIKASLDDYTTASEPYTVLATSPVFGSQLTVPGNYLSIATSSGRCVTSDLHPGLKTSQNISSGVYENGSVENLGVIYYTYYVYPSGKLDYLTGEAIMARYTATHTLTLKGPSRGYWAVGSRDGVVLHEGYSTSTITVTTLSSDQGIYYHTEGAGSGYFPNWLTEHFVEFPPPLPPPVLDPTPTDYSATIVLNSGAGFIVPPADEEVSDPGEVGSLTPKEKFATLRCSMFGPAQHLIALRPTTEDSVLIGSLLASEPVRPTVNYNFIGYLA